MELGFNFSTTSGRNVLLHDKYCTGNEGETLKRVYMKCPILLFDINRNLNVSMNITKTPE
jgi:hypothetical protein